MLRVLTLCYERDQSDIQVITQKIAVLNTQFEEVAKARWLPEDVGSEFALMGYADKTDGWILKKRRELSIEISAEHAKRGAAEDALRLSFGRLEAFKSLTKKQTKIELKTSQST